MVPCGTPPQIKQPRGFLVPGWGWNPQKMHSKKYPAFHAFRAEALLHGVEAFLMTHLIRGRRRFWWFLLVEKFYIYNYIGLFHTISIEFGHFLWFPFADFDYQNISTGHPFLLRMLDTLHVLWSWLVYSYGYRTLSYIPICNEWNSCNSPIHCWFWIWRCFERCISTMSSWSWWQNALSSWQNQPILEKWSWPIFCYLQRKNAQKGYISIWSIWYVIYIYVYIYIYIYISIFIYIIT